MVKDLADVTAGGVMVGTIIGWLPAVAALFTIVWTGIRIYEWYQGRHTKD